MVEHFENSDGLGAIFPPMIYTVVALKCLGYDPDSPSVQWAWRQLDDLRIDEGKIPHSHAALPLPGLGHGHRHDRPLGRGPARGQHAICPCRGLVARHGDSEPGRLERAGRESRAERLALPVSQRVYPDIDDTAMVVMVLLPRPKPDEPAVP